MAGAAGVILAFANGPYGLDDVSLLQLLPLGGNW